MESQIYLHAFNLRDPLEEGAEEPTEQVFVGPGSLQSTFGGLRMVFEDTSPLGTFIQDEWNIKDDNGLIYIKGRGYADWEILNGEEGWFNEWAGEDNFVLYTVKEVADYENSKSSS